MDSTSAPLRDAALAAAEREWHVFPLQPRAKRPALHGRAACPGTGACRDGHQGWEQRATVDAGRIRAAWSHDRYNIGLATGPSALCVLDLDTLKPGEDTGEVPDQWREAGATCGEDVLILLAEQAGQPPLPDTLTVATPTGGWHLYYQAPAGAELRNTEGEQGRGLGWKIDTRARGGYVVAPGSVTPEGVYRVVLDVAPAPLPDWVVERLRPAPLPAAPVSPIRTGLRSRYLQATVRAEAAKVTDAARGQRNATLYGASLALGQLVAGGSLAAEEVTTALMQAAGGHLACRAYSEQQARQTITSGLAAGANRPRHVA